MIKHLYLMRHGETLFNVYRRIQGWCDSPLTEVGINQAIKAIAIARGFIAPSGKNIICIPAFSDILIDGEEKTAIKFIVETR